MKLLVLIIASLSLFAVVSCDQNLVGGWREISADDNETLNNIVSWTLTELSSSSNLGSMPSLLSVKKAESQVVAGANYRFTIEVKVDSKNYSCQATVFNQSWTNTRRFLDGPTCEEISN